MGFLSFLGQVVKILFGYGLGFLLMIGGVGALGQGYNIIGGLVALFGFVLLLFGVYSEREL